jgi:hypothetical protein
MTRFIKDETDHEEFNTAQKVDEVKEQMHSAEIDAEKNAQKILKERAAEEKIAAEK